MGRRTLPEALLFEIVARLPLRSIARFKSVCKQWKSVIESSYFRGRFISLHRNSSSSWSLMFKTDYLHPNTEAIGFHGCRTWGLPKSLGSYISSFQRYLNRPTSKYFYVASSNGLIWIEVFMTRTENLAYIHKSFVGNPVIRQWVEIPPPPEPSMGTGLVTRVEDDGVVSSFKVVRTFQSRDRDRNEWRVYVYSSLTGLWTYKRLVSSCPVYYAASYPSMSLNGTLYLYSSEHGVLIAYDFYAEEGDNQCRVIPLPVPAPDNKDVRRCLTASGGDVFLIEVRDQILKSWSLNNSNSKGEWWQQSHEVIDIIPVWFDVDCFPMAANPHHSDNIYLWSFQHNSLMSSNLRNRELIVYQESGNYTSREGCCVVNSKDSKGYMDSSCNVASVLILSQFVLPPWMDSVPRPPN